MCCQESGEREASVSLFCPRAKPGEKKFRKVSSLPSVTRGRGIDGANSRSRVSANINVAHQPFVYPTNRQ